MIIQTLCTDACTPDFRKALTYHALIKAGLRILVKDFRRSRITGLLDQKIVSTIEITRIKQ
jgi:hypothetical protein